MPVHFRRACALAMAVAALSAAPLRAAWLGATSGSANDAGHSYLTNANWSGGATEWTFNPALTGPTSLYFSSNAAIPSGGWSIVPTGNQPLTLLGGGGFDANGGPVPTPGDRTVTLGGNLIVGTSTGQGVTLGSTTAGLGLNINLGNGSRTITTVRGTGAAPDVQIVGAVGSSIGSVLYLAGSASPAGSLLLGNGHNNFISAVYVNAGSLLLGANATAGTGNTVLGTGTAPVYIGDNAVTGQNAALLTYGPYTIGRNITVRAGNTGAITLGGAQSSGNSAFTGTVSLGKDVTLQALGDSEVAFNGPLQGDPAANVFIAGGGTVVLAGPNTYTGATTIETGGAARITGSLAARSAVVVQPGGSLELAGVAGSPLADTSVVTNDGALLVSQPAVVGAVGGAGMTMVNSNLSAASIVQTTLVIGAGGAVTIRDHSGGTGSAAVPEPGTWALIAIGLLGLLAFRRRCGR